MSILITDFLIPAPTLAITAVWSIFSRRPRKAAAGAFEITIGSVIGMMAFTPETPESRAQAETRAAATREATVVRAAADKEAAATREENARKGELAKAEAEKMCQADLRCLSDYASKASFACPPYVERLAKNDFQWTGNWSETKFPRFRWRDREAGVITFVGEQNQVSEWI
jgi:hypothetical protein